MASDDTVRYYLSNTSYVGDKLVMSYLNEFHSAGEYCRQLWILEEGGSMDQFRHQIDWDANTDILTFSVDGKMVGMGRCTRFPKHPENGRIGYSIRPSCRGRMYAPVLIRMLEDYCCKVFHLKPCDVTACVEQGNEKSRKALIAAGFKPTGTVYEWTGGRYADEYAPDTRSHS